MKTTSEMIKIRNLQVKKKEKDQSKEDDNDWNYLKPTLSKREQSRIMKTV